MASFTSNPTSQERHSARSLDPARRALDFDLVATDSAGDQAYLELSELNEIAS